MLDNTTYALDSLAARDEKNRRKNHNLRRTAGAVICLAALGVGAKSLYDGLGHETSTVSTADAAFAAAATGLNKERLPSALRKTPIGAQHTVMPFGML